MKKIQAFILAAGYGERLRPITDHTPKPLLPILGKPTIELVIDNIASLSVDYFGINTHHKAEMLNNWAEHSLYADKIKIFYERNILGTGGALKNAQHFLNKSVFIVHNADIISDINLEKLAEEHFLSGNTVTLAVHNYEKFNNLVVDTHGKLIQVEKTEKKMPSGLCKIAFTGIAMYSKDFLDFLPAGYSSVVEAWLTALNAGKVIGTVDFSGCSWTDIGTPDAYVTAVVEMLKNTGETIYVHPSVDCSDTTIEGYAVFEKGCVAGSGTYLKNSVFLPSAQVPDGVSIEDSLVGPDYMVKVEKVKNRFLPGFSEKMLENFFHGERRDIEFTLIGTGGSDRKYYRLQTKEISVVLMVCEAEDPDYERHIAYSEFFRRHSLPVPEIFEKDEQKKQALFEDLGDLSLYAWLKCRKNPDVIERTYRKVLDILVQLHTNVTTNSADCQLLGKRVFDYEHLRWETSYFSEMFLNGRMEFPIDDQRKIDMEFYRLAKTVDAFPKTIVHRDFQSQNIMITKDDFPRVIDYQGARLGPPAYDLASVLWDPYFRLDNAMRNRLVTYYIEAIKLIMLHDFDEDTFRYSLLLCRLQRHMQALGAYSFLSQVKGKKHFLKYIPMTIAYLMDETSRAHVDYPVLHRIIVKLNAPCNSRVPEN